MSNEEAKNNLTKFLEAAMQKGLISNFQTLDLLRESIETLAANNQNKTT